MEPSDRSWELQPGMRIHLIGIGGAGMSALARILLERGLRVSGSDLRGGRSVTPLQAMGAEIWVGHAAEHVAGADLVVASTAVAASNPEMVRAREGGVPVAHRAELLDALMDDAMRILIAGTHGKTTTTAMTTVALQAAGVDPSFAIGGMIHEAGTSAHHGSGDAFIAEADESDRSFLVYRPHCAVVTNVELDHHDVYRDVGQVLDAFAEFVANRVEGGVAIICRDDAGATDLLARVSQPLITYGEHPESTLRIADIRFDGVGASWTLSRDGTPLGDLRIDVPGRHNVLNATAAAAAALWAGASFDDVAAGLATFTGAQRRFQRVGVVNAVTVVDDYAHHPTELAATLKAARQTVAGGRVIAVFQPHRYSRTAALGRELGHALQEADVAIITDVYAAGEAPVPGITGDLVADAARESGVDASFVAAISDVPDAVARIATAGDLILTMGAGDITEVGALVLRAIGERGGTG